MEVRYRVEVVWQLCVEIQGVGRKGEKLDLMITGWIEIWDRSGEWN